MTDFTYVIERFDVSGEDEVLIERAELVREGHALVCLTQGSEERILDCTDVPSAIAGDPVLSEVRANQITRITASDAVYDELPFILRVPGDPADFDPALWSEALKEEHTETVELSQNEYRVAYVNGQRWCAYPTAGGGSGMLIEDETLPGVPEVREWASLTIAEGDSGQEDSFAIGLGTQLAVVATHSRYESFTGDPKPVVLWRRAADPAGDAAMTVDWLLDCIPNQLGLQDEAHRQMLAQLLVEVAVRQNKKENVPASYLAAGHRDQPVDAGDVLWNLWFYVPGVTSGLLAELVSQRGPAMAEIVMAATNPESAEGAARRAAVEALGEWALKLSEPDPGESADQQDDDLDEDDPEDDPDAPWNRDPVDGLPAVIEPGQIAIEFWEKDRFSGEHVLYDFIFYWDGERKADWFYDISMKNPGLSPMSSAPIGGTATWDNGVDVDLTVKSDDFDLDEESFLKDAAPKGDSIHAPRTWVDLASLIAGVADSFIE
jgi:hypothetical protein